MAIILKANKVNLSSVLFVSWYHSPNFLDTPRIGNTACILFRHYSLCAMNHTVTASHYMTSFDNSNTYFVCRMKQICDCTKEKKLLVAEPCWNPMDMQISRLAFHCTALRPTRITAPNESAPFINSFLELKTQSPEWIKPTTRDWCNCTTTTTNPAGSCGWHAYGTMWTTNGM
jgi:hypothetical protein